ncbi:hypothetical protein [Brevibacillus sp. SYSU BS000544]|uniref:hypothetical protein n=1 Tax=Brevibacillus sp. SYSU BS000544 TaxID=3416443 RepID=UPI003CE504A8
MSVDLINNVLDKLKAKTGREWTFGDLLNLAQKLPDLNSDSIDAVIQELNDMGLDLPEDAKERVKQKLDENPNFSLEDVRNLDIQEIRRVKASSKTRLAKKKTGSARKRSHAKNSGKKELLVQIHMMQAATKKRKKK